VRIPTPEDFGMEVLIPTCRKWTTVLIVAYPFTAPWIFGISEAKASSVNAWIIGACILVAPRDRLQGGAGRLSVRNGRR
jgi:SPW repeat